MSGRLVVAAALGATALLAWPGELRGQGPPNAPINLEIDQHDDHFHLSWDEDDSGNRLDALFFRIFRDGSVVATSGNTKYEDHSVSFGLTYAYRVAGVDVLGRQGDLSASVSATLKDPDIPGLPKDLAAVAVSPSRIELDWNPPDGGGDDDDGGGADIVSYNVYRNESAAIHAQTTSTEFSDTGLTAFTEYAYRVSAVNENGTEGPRSAPVSARTLDGSPPTAPQNLDATAVSTSEIALSWSAATDPQSGIKRYYVYRNGGTSPIDSTTATEYVDAGLSGNAERTYEVAAVNGAGTVGPRSNSATASPLDGSPPSAPGGLVAEATGAQLVTLSWTASSDPETGVTRYLVYRDGAGTPIDSTAATTYEDSGVEPETEYVYRVSARNGAGLESAPSSPASVTTPPVTDGTAPSMPDDFSANATGPSRVELAWSAAEDPDSGISEYRVYRDGARIGASPGGGFVDLTVESGATYGYQVSAVNGDGLEGPRTATVEVTTPGEGDTVPPAPPSDLRVVTD